MKVSVLQKGSRSKRKLRVLIISHAYVVGVNQGKLKAIADTGIELALLAPSNWQAREWNRFLPLETPFDTYRIYSAPVLFTGRVGAHIYSPLKIWQVIKDFQPDVIQLEEEIFSLCALEVSFCTKLLDLPLVVFGWENQQRRLPWLRRWIRDFAMANTSLYLAGNQDGVAVIRNWHYQGEIEVMPQMGVDSELFAPQPKTKTAELKIGFLGRLVPEKGIDLLFTAAQQLRQQGLKYQLIIYGSGTSEAELRKKATELQIDDLVVWAGAVSHAEAPGALSQFEVLVLPSRTVDTWKEQFGHVLIEAMSMGIPVVGSTCGEIPHVISRDELVFPEGDAAALAKILARCIVDRTWCEQMGSYGIERVEQHYSHQRIARRLIEHWQKLVPTHR